MLEQLLPSFLDEIEKIAATEKQQWWGEFEKKLKKSPKKFPLEVVDDSIDPLLNKYVKNVGGVLASKDLKAYVQSSSDPRKEHQVKVLPSGRFGCTCKDWQYKHSTKNTDCHHIKRYKQYLQGLIGERRD